MTKSPGAITQAGVERKPFQFCLAWPVQYFSAGSKILSSAACDRLLLNDFAVVKQIIVFRCLHSVAYNW
jgi:hypothetical protein